MDHSLETTSFDIEAWWLAQKAALPVLHDRALSLLYTQPVVTAVDAVFSSIDAKFGEMRRVRLTPDVRRQLLFLYLNQDISGALSSSDRHHVLRHAGLQAGR
eukprot:TRINITY_DN850_c1_g1_i16.p2 TRINITY_DN850_c1_g1~~TRINITY_DN850_c1_g1_i16.p2  ORF type:complete len:102 (-),score=26.05 TRINITY_DN850_c1_g1_i16:779-1084(-)